MSPETRISPAIRRPAPVASTPEPPLAASLGDTVPAKEPEPPNVGDPARTVVAAPPFATNDAAPSSGKTSALLDDPEEWGPDVSQVVATTPESMPRGSTESAEKAAVVADTAKALPGEMPIDAKPLPPAAGRDGTILISPEKRPSTRAYPIQPRPAPAPAVGQTVYLGPPPTPPADLRPRSNPPPSLFPVQLPVQPARIASASPRRALHVALGVAGAVAFLAIGIVAAVMMKASASADKHWVAPMVLSANDPRVVQVAATLQQETSRRSELLLEKTDLEGRLREAERGLQLEESFQASYQAALQADLANQRAELRRTLALLAAEESARSASSTESADKSVERQAKLAIVRQRIRLLESATKAVEGRLDLTRYSTVALQREYDASLITVAKGRELAAGLRKALAATESMLKEKDALLETILQSPYGAAISGDVTLGFLPYENVNEVNAGEPLFACRTAFLFCRQVGTVGERLPGEARGANPRSSQTQLRGQLVRLNLQERGASERPVLYAGRKPL